MISFNFLNFRIISWLKAEQKINDTPEREIEDFFDQVNEPPPSKRTFYDTVSELVKNTHTGYFKTSRM